MDRTSLLKDVRTLATLPETEDSVVSCYVALENGQLKNPNIFEEQIRSLSTGLTGDGRRALDEALQPVRSFLTVGLSPEAKGAAVFSRAGNSPFFLTVRFRVPLPNWIVVDKAPNIYNLVELKDTYERYFVMLTTRASVRIIEIHIGEVTRQVWAAMPETKSGIVRKHAKEHYQRQVKEREHRFIKEQLQVLEQLMVSKEHAHLILAGHPNMTARVKEELPKSLLPKLVDVVRASDSDVVQSTIEAFIKAEEKESQTIAEKLARQVHSGGLAVVGTTACFMALRRNQADTLVLLKAYAPDQAWACRACDFMDPGAGRIAACPECGSENLAYRDVKERMVRLAEQQLCGVEIVNESEFLARVGGVGCLLRYRLAQEYRREGACI